MKNIIGFLIFVLLLGCHKKASITKEIVAPTLQQKIVNLKDLMQGTFVAHAKYKDGQLRPWRVTGGEDSVVLYSIEIIKNELEGDWIYSYEFMTSMPNDPIYTSIKQIKKVAPDIFQISYYLPPEKFTLKEILTDGYLATKIDFDKLKKTDKKVDYIRKEQALFEGKSILYEDKDCHCQRQNTYLISPNYYEVYTDFYTKGNPIKIDRKQRPNLLVRRNISQELLQEIAQKKYNLDQ